MTEDFIKKELSYNMWLIILNIICIGYFVLSIVLYGLQGKVFRGTIDAIIMCLNIYAVKVSLKARKNLKEIKKNEKNIYW